VDSFASQFVLSKKHKIQQIRFYSSPTLFISVPFYVLVEHQSCFTDRKL
jgi:hypothetical protein